MKIVKVQGGAGNQLFQASKVYAEIDNPREPIILYTRSLARYKAKSSLFEPAWAAFNFQTRNDYLIRLLLKLDRVALIRKVMAACGITCVQGYFQEHIHLAYAQTVYSKLSEHSSGISPVFKGVIHCRGGDYLEPPNDTIYNQIGLSAYKAAIGENLSSQWAVVGNHQDHSSALSKEGAIAVTGAIKDDLQVMGSAEIVVCSNSTFACWGGLFCLLNGGRVLAPKRYYLDPDYAPNPFDALAATFPDRVAFFGEDDA